MSIQEKALATLEVLGFIGAIIAALLDQQKAAIVMIGGFLLVWLIWLTRQVLSIRESMEQQGALGRHLIEPVERHLVERPLSISGKAKNRYPMRSDFVHWEQCALMIWVYVSPRGQGLRTMDSNKYILAHSTGPADEQGHSFFNRFSLGFFPQHQQFSVTFSNNRADQEGERNLAIPDTLDPGWHHFLVAWDRARPILLFVIDGERRQFDRASFSHWPERLQDKAYIGSWATDISQLYCDTQVYGLALYDQYFDHGSDAYKDHMSMKPSSR